MRAEVEDWPDGRVGVLLSVAQEEIGPLKQRLAVLRRNAGQHFHLSADGPDEGRVGDIEVFVMQAGDLHNLRMTSLAYFPGDTIPLRGEGWRFAPGRSLVAGALAAVGVWGGLSAAGAAFVTFATNDYRPILVRGLWQGMIAVLAFHASAVVARGWKARIVSLSGTLLVLCAVSEIVIRLTALLGR